MAKNNSTPKLTIEETYQKFVYKLKEIREEKGISTAQLSKITGILQPNITRMETFNVEPRLTTVIKYAEAVGVDIMQIFK